MTRLVATDAPTMTVGELREALEHFDAEDKVYFQAEGWSLRSLTYADNDIVVDDGWGTLFTPVVLS